MAIPYRTDKFKSANMFAMAIWEPTAKFNSRQYFRLYSIIHVHRYMYSLERDVTGNSMEDIEHCIDIVCVVRKPNSGCLGDECANGGLYCV